MNTSGSQLSWGSLVHEFGPRSLEPQMGCQIIDTLQQGPTGDHHSGPRTNQNSGTRLLGSQTQAFCTPLQNNSRTNNGLVLKLRDQGFESLTMAYMHSCTDLEETFSVLKLGKFLDPSWHIDILALHSQHRKMCQRRLIILPFLFRTFG